MEEHEVRTGDGHAVRAVALGRGAPLVLCHGGTGWWQGFDALAELLSDRVRVIRWEQRASAVLDDLGAVRAHFRLPRFALLGHGGGAEVALRYALAHPDAVSSLVGVSVTGPPGAFAGFRELAVPTLVVDGVAAERPGRAADALAAVLPDVARVVLPGAGPVPWTGSPGSFGWAVLAHLAR